MVIFDVFLVIFWSFLRICQNWSWGPKIDKIGGPKRVKKGGPKKGRFNRQKQVFLGPKKVQNDKKGGHHHSKMVTF